MIRRSLTVALLVAFAAGLAWSQEADPVNLIDKKKPPKPAPANPAAKKVPTGPAEIHRGRGKLFVKEHVWDFGHVAQQTKVIHRFVLENVGDDTLFIERIRPT